MVLTGGCNPKDVSTHRSDVIVSAKLFPAHPATVDHDVIATVNKLGEAMDTTRFSEICAAPARQVIKDGQRQPGLQRKTRVAEATTGKEKKDVCTRM